MRKAMIGISIMLVLLQFWPMLFGRHHGGGTAMAATATAPVAALPAIAKPIPTLAAKPLETIASTIGLVNMPPPQSCYDHYKAAFAACRAGDQACAMRSADRWDLCEATGTWSR